MKILKRIVRALTGNRWEVRRTIWPYDHGFGVYNPGTKTLIEHGLTRKKADERCREMNEAKP